MALFSEDLNFLKKFQELIVLKDAQENSQVIICPQLQSKVMTSTAEGMEGRSLGYINYDLVSSQKIHKNINPVGGEDRFWVGPEGGQYSVFFKHGDEFTLANAITPAAIDREAFETLYSDINQAKFFKKLELKNYSGTIFNAVVEREINLIPISNAEGMLGLDVPSKINYVGFQLTNSLINSGVNEWVKETGLLSIWILGMFPPSDSVTCIFPYTNGFEKHQPLVNDAYFGNVPEDRLKISKGNIFFKGDGKYRSKIGLPAQHAKPIIGSYDAGRGILTVVQFSFSEKASDYVSSMWEIQTDPYKGDVANAYNDGGTDGPGFYELESSSPAAALKPGQRIVHVHRTFHFTGTERDLDLVSLKLFNMACKDIKTIF